MKRVVVAGGVALAFTLTSIGAFAQDNRRRRPRKVIQIETTNIEGRIQKPKAFYILQRSNLNFEGLELKNSFVPKIIKSVEQAPF